MKTMLSLSVTEYLSRVSKPLICERIVFSSDSLRFCFICSLSSSDSFSFFTLSWFNIFSSQRRAFIFRSLAPPEITPDFWNSVPSNDTDYNQQQQQQLLIQLLSRWQEIVHCLVLDKWQSLTKLSTTGHFLSWPRNHQDINYSIITHGRPSTSTLTLLRSINI